MPCVEIAAPAYARPQGPEPWIADTGSGYDLIGEHDLADSDLLRCESCKPVGLLTANGPVSADRVLPFQSAVLWDCIKPLLLQSTPAVVSVGLRCMGEGWAFH